MKTLLLRISWTGIVAAAATAMLRADIQSTPEIEEAHAILCSIGSRATHSSSVLSPTSQLTRQHAQALASSFAISMGKDIIVGTVAPTGSMRPYFDEHALLLLEAVPFDQLRLGDVVTFRHPRLAIDVVHRLVEKRGNAFWTKGDHNVGMDDVYVTPENYHRRLVGVIYFQPGPGEIEVAASSKSTGRQANVGAHRHG